MINKEVGYFDRGPTGRIKHQEGQGDNYDYADCAAGGRATSHSPGRYNQVMHVPNRIERQGDCRKAQRHKYECWPIESAPNKQRNQPDALGEQTERCGYSDFCQGDREWRHWQSSKAKQVMAVLAKIE